MRAEKLTTYQELYEYVDKFNTREIPFLVIFGRGGTGKTHTVTSALDRPIVFSGHVTPLGVYQRLQAEPAKLVVFDDVDSLFKNQTSVALLKQVCELKEDKPVRYNSSRLAAEDQEFISNNKVVMLFNGYPLKSDNPHMQAIATRAIPVEFAPTNDEVMGVFEKIATNKEVLKFFQRYTDNFEVLDIRLLGHAENMSAAGLNWQRFLRAQWKANSEVALLDSLALMPIEEGNKLWIEQTGKSVRSLQLKLKEAGLRRKA